MNCKKLRMQSFKQVACVPTVLLFMHAVLLVQRMKLRSRHAGLVNQPSY